MKKEETKKEIIKIIRELSESKNANQVFTDVVISCAYALANATQFSQKREDEFNRIIKQYGEDGKMKFAEILASLFNYYSDISTEDILGDIYMEMKLGNKNRGQFFTPSHVSDLMSKLTISEMDSDKEIEDKNYISILDPACGSGRLLYSSYSSLLEKKVDPKKILLVGDDIDIMCCCMTYIQLSLMGINAIVNHKNTLTSELYDTFYTSAFINNKELQDSIKKEHEVKEGYQL